MKNDQIDDLDIKILNLIGGNARIPFLEVARECNVSGAAIHQRVTKLTENGIILGSKFLLDWERVGFDTCAYIGVQTPPGDVNYDDIIEELKKIKEITECYFSAGRFDIVFKIVAKNNKHLLDILQQRIVPMGFISSHTVILYKEAFRRQVPIE